MQLFERILCHLYFVTLVAEGDDGKGGKGKKGKRSNGGLMGFDEEQRSAGKRSKNNDGPRTTPASLQRKFSGKKVGHSVFCDGMGMKGPWRGHTGTFMDQRILGFPRRKNCKQPPQSRHGGRQCRKSIAADEAVSSR